MQCAKCGNTLPDGSKFCQFCGSALEASAPVVAPVAPIPEPVAEPVPVAPAPEPVAEPVAAPVAPQWQPPVAAPVEPPQKKKSGKAGLIVAVILLALALVGSNAAQYFFLYSPATAAKAQLEEEKTAADAKVEEQAKKIADLETSVAELTEDNDQMSKELEDADDLMGTIEDLEEQLDTANEYLEFYTDFIVIVNASDTTKYHSLDCEDVDLNSFYAFNEDYAKSQSINPCDKCR